MTIEFKPIGYVTNDIKEQTDTNWGKVTSQIVFEPEYAQGLKGLSDFSHINVIYYLDKAKFVYDKHIQRHPQGREDLPIVGLFAQRVKDRPNPIGVTSVKLIDVKDNVITVQGLDAIDGTPVLDIKPYFPVYDTKKDAVTPEWVDILMKEYF